MTKRRSGRDLGHRRGTVRPWATMRAMTPIAVLLTAEEQAEREATALERPGLALARARMRLLALATPAQIQAAGRRADAWDRLAAAVRSGR